MAKKYFYAVRKGRCPGIYDSWDECKAQVMGFKSAEYKKFSTVDEAKAFISPDQDLKPIEIIGKDELIAYVDGSYNINTKEFGYGIVLIDCNGNEETMNGKGDNKAYAVHRNVAGEVYGSVKAIQTALDKEYKKIYIHYDYKGIEAWAKGDWKANKELTQKYKEFIDSCRGRIQIEFIKVKAHSNDKYNDLADRLAKEACGVEI